MERWKDIDGFGGKYQISDRGNVRSFSRWKNGELLAGGMTGKYRFVVLVKTCRQDAKNYYIHRLVAMHFIPNPDNLPEVNHIDGDTLNNHAENLEWCTRQGNAHHASATGILSKAHKNESGAKHPRAKAVMQYAKDGTLIREWESVNQIQRETGFLACSIFCCCNHKKNYNSAYGYKWEYKNGKTENNNSEENP